MEYGSGVSGYIGEQEAGFRSIMVYRRTRSRVQKYQGPGYRGKHGVGFKSIRV